jgi:hypothetical protein
MSARIFVFLAVMLLGGCVSSPPAPVVTTRTLEGDPRLPAQDIADLCSPKEWNLLRMEEYRAFVILNGQIRPDGSVDLGKTTASYPDADPSWNRLARAYAKHVVLNVSTLGSNILPAGEIFVIFFAPSLDGNKVMIYARQKDEPLPGTRGKARYISSDTY